jgi:integrase
MGNFNPRQISEHEINEYIKARRALNIKPISIERELSVISNVFNKLRYLDIRMKDVPNPTRLYDRDLLKVAGGRITKNVHRFTSEEKEKFFETLDNYENPELAWISKLILLTAMRRTETVLLKWSQIFENHLRLETTKRGRPRIVYLSPEAKELLSSIPKRGNEDRVFTYGVLGYDSSFKRVMKDIGLSHIKIHGLRKEAISTFIERIGAGNSVLIAEFLGVSSVRTIEEHVESNSIPDLATQEQVLKSVGHSNSAVTKNHYFSFKK